MKKILISLLFVGLVNVISAQTSNDIKCIYCEENTIGKFASAIGQNNFVEGKYSLATGYSNLIKGEYSLASGESNTINGNYSGAFGKNANTSGQSSFALGQDVQALGDYNFAFGKSNLSNGILSHAYGNQVTSSEIGSISLGNFLRNEGTYSLVIGSGISSSAKLFSNTDYSLVIGFKSIKPTFFVGESQSIAKTGRIGIGNITSPAYKLHIKADDNEDAAIFLQPTGSNYFGNIFFGDENHSISAKTGEALTFFTEAGQNFAFETGNILQTTGYNISSSQIKAPDETGLSLTDMNGNGIFVNDVGNVGIGTTEAPAYKLDVNGDIRFTGQLYKGTELFDPSQWTTAQNDIYFDGGNVGIGTDNPTKTLHVNGDCYFNGNSFLDGQLGIGTSDLYDFQLAVSGKTQINQLEVQTDVSVGAGIKMYSDGNLWVQTEVVVESTNPWPDFVFSDNYQGMSILELDSFIKHNKHLPYVPTQQDIDENGIRLGAMSNILLQKIEELTLYVIEQQKEIEILKSQISK